MKPKHAKNIHITATTVKTQEEKHTTHRFKIMLKRNPTWALKKF
jgi:hypothetical protein